MKRSQNGIQCQLPRFNSNYSGRRLSCVTRTIFILAGTWSLISYLAPKLRGQVLTERTKARNDTFVSQGNTTTRSHRVISTAARKCLVKIFFYIYRPDDIIIRLDDILIRPDELLYRPDDIIIRLDKILIPPDEIA